MKASSRWLMMFLGWGVVLTPAIALAQNTADPQAKTQPSDTVGPTELQNFSLSGRGAKPADQPPEQSAPQPQPTMDTGTATAQVVPRADRVKPESRRLAHSTLKRSPRPQPISDPIAATTTEVTLQPSATATISAGAQTSSTNSFSPPAHHAAEGVPPRSAVPYLPWLVGAFALGMGALVLLWRRRSREEFAGDAGVDMFSQPQVPPAPVPAARPTGLRPDVPAHGPVPVPSKPRSGGIVSSRLRPNLEIAVQPLRCLVEGDRVVLEFELELFNTGTAPARAVQAEAGLLNAGGTNEQELAAFYSRPVGSGEQIDAIGPMKRMAFTSQVIAPRASLPDYEVGGRKAIVPVLAFNALYQWSGGQAQTSAAFLVGQETRSEKLAPFVSEGPSREFRGLGAHLLPASVRT